MFWFNVGLFTLMTIDSLMVLASPWSSLPMMLKLSSVVMCPSKQAQQQQPVQDQIPP